MLIQQATLCWFLWRILAIQHHWFPKIIKCSNEGLTLETSASETHYDGQFTLPTQLVKPNYFVIPHQSFFRNLPRWFMLFIETMHGEISHGKSYGRCCAFCFCHVMSVMSCFAAKITTQIKWKVTTEFFKPLLPQILAIIFISYQ